MGDILVHEFMSLDGVIEEPTWTFEYGFDPQMGDAIATLVRAMLADGLVDELHLCVYPTTRGSGLRLFEEGLESLKFERIAHEAYENGVLYLAYRPLS